MSGPSSTNHIRPRASSECLSTKLTALGAMIDAELQSWLTHLEAVPKSTYTSLANPGNTPQTKTAILIHLLSTLPRRHKALAAAYKADDADQVRLSDVCASLLNSLKSEAADVDLSGFYEYKLFKGKNFCAEILSMEQEILTLEQERIEELKQVLSMYEDMVNVRNEGSFGEAELQMLVETMKIVGLRANSVISGGA